MDLRPYQQAAKEAIFREWELVKSTLLVLPTGCGKTIVFAKTAEDCVRMSGRVLILAHRGELLDQARDKIGKVTGLGCAVEKAEQTAIGSWFRITVGSVQSMMSEKRLEKFPPDYFSHIIIDEAHHAVSDSYQRVLQHFPDAHILGVTATPDRGDMKELGSVFKTLAYEYTLPQAIKDGYLCPIKALTIPLKLDISKVGISAGDFKPGEIGTALDPYLEQIAEEMKKYCANRKTVVFLPLIATSQKFCDILKSAGFNAAEVNGNSENRAEILSDFESGKYNVLCNSMLLTEGWDCPSVDCVIVLRPTKVRALYCQMVGRGTRLCEGKDHLLLLDFLWHTERHELCRPAHLICENEETAKQMTADLADKNGCPVDVTEAAETAESETIAKREEALKKQFEKYKTRKRNLVDPLEFAVSVHDRDLMNYQPAFGWECQPPSQAQMQALESRGIDPNAIQSAGMAEQVLRAACQRQVQGLSTAKQIARLERYGFQNVGAWSFEQANNMIARIAAQGWRRVPPGVNPREYVPMQEGVYGSS
jgi:superfamily II DNA or RNA helicase